MNVFRILFFLLITIISDAMACRMENPTRHVNPDSSQGGLVNGQAKVASTAYIGYNAKVCDSAWIDGNAKVLDYAVVKENAWVRNFSIIKDKAEVSGSSYINGSQNNDAIISGYSRVQGSVKILSGTKISGNSLVYGSSTLIGSSLSDNAKVCQGSVIKNEKIADDYFCISNTTKSRAVIELGNLSEDRFNELSNIIILKSSENLFLDKHFFEIELNGNLVELADFEISDKTITINTESFNLDGYTSIKIKGRDRFKRQIEAFVDDFVIGNQELIFNVPGSADFTFDVTGVLDGRTLVIPHTFNSGTLTLKGIPNSGIKFSINIKGISDASYIDQEIKEGSEIPVELASYQLPEFIDNSLDLVAGLNSWAINKPTNVVLLDNELSLIFDDIEDVTLAKTIFLDKGQDGVSFKLKPSTSKSMFDDQMFFEAVLISPTSKIINVKRFSLADLSSLEVANEGIIDVSLLKTSTKSEYVTVLLRLVANPIKLNSGSLRLNKIERPRTIVNFEPMNFSVLNTATQAGFPKTSPLTNEKCKMSEFDFSNTIEAKFDKLNFFSIGPTPTMNVFEENRIFGSLSLSRLLRSQVKNIRLVISDNTDIVVENLSTCALSRFNEMSANDLVNFKLEKNLVKPLFSIPKILIQQFDVQKGKKIFLQVYVYVKRASNNGEDLFKSTPIPLEVLSSPISTPDFIYDDIDYYDSSGKDQLRTGGDKWILPAYAEILQNMLNRSISSHNERWQFGDLSKLNGGAFPVHKKTHQAGLDADVKFQDFLSSSGNRIEFNTDNLKNNLSNWSAFLSKIEDFLKTIKPEFKFIRDIYLERKDEIAKKMINIKFANRCFEDERFIQFERQNGEGSLLRDTPPHHHHLHLRFHPSTRTGSAGEVLQDVKPTNDLNELLFELKSDGTGLKIYPKDEKSFDEQYIVWRFQDIDGFDNLHTALELGSWPSSSNVKQLQENKKFVKDYFIPKTFIKVTFANKVSGACIQRDVEVDLNLIKKSKNGSMIWSYKKIGSKYEQTSE